MSILQPRHAARAIVMVEVPAESLSATNEAGARRQKHRIDEFVAEAPVIPLLLECAMNAAIVRRRWRSPKQSRD